MKKSTTCVKVEIKSHAGGMAVVWPYGGKFSWEIDINIQVLKRDPDDIKENIKKEEAARKVPLRINSAYGKRLNKFFLFLASSWLCENF